MILSCRAVCDITEPRPGKGVMEGVGVLSLSVLVAESGAQGAW